MSSLLSFLSLKLSETKIVNFYSTILRLLIFCFFKKLLFIYPVKNIYCKDNWCVSLQLFVFGEKSVIIQIISINLLFNLVLGFILEVKSSIGHLFSFFKKIVFSLNFIYIILKYDSAIKKYKTGVPTDSLKIQHIFLFIIFQLNIFF